MKIECRGLTVRFGAQTVLDRVDIDEPDVRALALIGPSGAGKSTLLRVLGGLLTPDEGAVSLDGRQVIYNERALLKHRRDIGFVFQARGLFPHLTAEQNIMLPLIHAHGQTPEQAREAAQSLLKRFSLAQDAHKRPYELSGGQCQRIAIARAVAPRPRLLLLDEPTSALDPELTAEVLDMIRELQGENLSMIIVTHEMGFARHACDRALFLSDGRILESGASAELFTAPQTPQLQGFLRKVLEWRA
jgi:polar amino acid transport system ATP-binding protein